MVEAPKEQGALAPVVSLPLVKQIHDIQKGRGNDFCRICYPKPNTNLIQHGQPYSGGKAYLVLIGEVKEFVTVLDDSGKKYRIKSKTFGPGSIVFPQALDITFREQSSVASYWLGKNSASLVELHHDLMTLLGYSPEVITVIARSEHERTLDAETQTRLVHAFYAKRMNAFEIHATEKRRRADDELRQAHTRIEELESLLKQKGVENQRLSDLVLMMEQRLEQDIPPVLCEELQDLVHESHETGTASAHIELADSDLVEIEFDETIVVGVAPPSVFPPADADDDSKPTQIPPPREAEERRRDTQSYLRVAPFIGLTGELEAETTSRAAQPPEPTADETPKTPTIPLPSGIDGVAELLHMQEVPRPTLIPGGDTYEERSTMIDPVPAQSFFKPEFSIPAPTSQRKPMVCVRSGTVEKKP